MLFERLTNTIDPNNSSGRLGSYYIYPYFADEKTEVQSIN